MCIMAGMTGGIDQPLFTSTEQWIFGRIGRVARGLCIGSVGK
jgi:hypothetical protein